MSRILSTAKLILFAAIFGAMIFVGCNNSSSDDETNGGGNTTVPDDSGTGGGTGGAMPSTITIGEYTAKVEASEGVTYSDGKFILPKSPEDRATLSLIFEDAVDASGGFRFDYSRNEAGENEGYSAGVEFFDIVADDDSEPFAASWGVGYWTHAESTTYKSVTIITDNGDYKPSNEIKEKYSNGMKKLKTVKLTASPYFDWTVHNFKIAGSNTAGEIVITSKLITYSKGVAEADGKYTLPKAESDDGKATLEITFEDGVDVSDKAFKFDYEATVSNSYTASVQFFDVNGENFANTYGAGVWNSDKTNPPTSGIYDSTKETEEKSENMKKLKTIKLIASTEFVWTVYNFRFE